MADNLDEECAAIEQYHHWHPQFECPSEGGGEVHLSLKTLASIALGIGSALLASASALYQSAQSHQQATDAIATIERRIEDDHKSIVVLHQGASKMETAMARIETNVEWIRNSLEQKDKSKP